jgi:hypothetical protein
MWNGSEIAERVRDVRVRVHVRVHVHVHDGLHAAHGLGLGLEEGALWLHDPHGSATLNCEPPLHRPARQVVALAQLVPAVD